MMVTFVSQCEKKALARTRRVLDAFADRIGDNTWQTVITNEGLQAVKKLLRKTATKSTAVSCHWIRSRSRSELIWVIGNRRKFDAHGRVPVNSTQNSSPVSSAEDQWIHAHSIQIVAVLAALLHDIGKATLGFQNKLFDKGKPTTGDPYRHEWISLRLFQAMIADCQTDEAWLNRLMDFRRYMQENPAWLNAWYRDGKGKKQPRLNSLPPLAQLVAWLIVTHHRLPTYKPCFYSAKERKNQQSNDYWWGPEMNMTEFYAWVEPYEGWVKSEAEDSDTFWQMKAVIMESKSWQRALTRWARKARDHVPLREVAQHTISDPLLMHLARLSLMLADHNYSSLAEDATSREKGDKELADKLAANTNKERKPKQALDEHLIGVGVFTKRVAQELPRLSERLHDLFGLPENHKPFLRQTQHKRYQWQNGAFNLARNLQAQSQEQGFFGINMASTGMGKTLANARIMYALGKPDTGARFTIALGLRVLTLQTGRALRERLSLTEDDLAILVGGSANRQLFELAQNEKAKQDYETNGSESQEPLLDHLDQVVGSVLPEEFNTLLADPKARQLITAPVVSCTVDHIMQASECARGGRYIAPVLRLLTSDLILDEPDDFDQSDLPALARLVHLTGLYGSKVLLSSATLTPDMVTGLYQAYAAGRRIWNSHMGVNPALPVPCAWFDEYQQESQLCAEPQTFMESHHSFVTRRAARLGKERVRRKASLLPLDLPAAPENDPLKVNTTALSRAILQGALELHHAHAQTCPQSAKCVSIGLVRFANVAPIIHIARSLQSFSDIPEDTQIHLCCYHAKQLMILRDSLEQKLDRILSRGEPDPLLTQPEIQTALNGSNCKHHVFIVLASPVAEVGRDHDYDWAIVEPSSMRSLVQLAGRVWRHRPDKIATAPNLLILDQNVKALKGETICFTRPGFEQEPRFKLSSHHCSDLIMEEQLNRVDSIPRIIHGDELQPQSSLADLEHAVMRDLLNNSSNFVSAFWRPNNGNIASVHLQKISPFRYQGTPEEDYVCLPIADEEAQFGFTTAESAWEDLKSCNFQITKIHFDDTPFSGGGIQPWLVSELGEALRALADKLDEPDIAIVALKFASVSLEKNAMEWLFHPWLGFWKVNR